MAEYWFSLLSRSTSYSLCWFWLVTELFLGVSFYNESKILPVSSCLFNSHSSFSLIISSCFFNVKKFYSMIILVSSLAFPESRAFICLLYLLIFWYMKYMITRMATKIAPHTVETMMTVEFVLRFYLLIGWALRTP